MFRLRSCWRLIVALLLPAGIQPLQAAITSISTPFDGASTETWESFPVGDPGSPVTFLGGQATIAGAHPFVWMTAISFGTPGGLGLGPFMAKAYDGTHGYVTSVFSGSARINFLTPVYDFGGYWGYSYGEPAAVFSFFDSTGALLGTQNFTYSAPNFNGTLEWQGWHSPVPIAAVEYTGNWLANDSLRINAVPEPSVAWLLLAAGLVVGCAKKLSRYRTD